MPCTSMTTRLRRAVLALGLLAAATPVRAQHGLTPGGDYDPAVPRPAAVLGYELGERFTPHHLLMRYLDRLAAASARIRVDTVAHTFEGREVVMAIVTSEANHARLDAIRALARRVADPRGAAQAELDAAARDLPAIVWLGYTVHGSEASGTEAAIGMLYQLAAGRDADTRMVLDSTVVLIDPVQNPDGHERHAQDVMRGRGAFGPQSAPWAMIHSGTWPGPRTSHYYFDLNRDWFIQSHPESRGRVRAMIEWTPHVAVDLHEMGSSSTYFFPPPMEPVNRNVHETVRRWWDIFAAANAAAFDRSGWSFFRGENYDELYPGYGSSWPIYTGAAGMTYEQASSQGGAIRRTDGTVLTLRQAAMQHYTAAWATALTSAQRRAERVRDYLTFRQTAVTDVQRGGGLRHVVFERDTQGRADSLAALLLRNGIEVSRLRADANVRDATRYGTTAAAAVRLPAGAYVVDMAQPMGRLAMALLEPDVVLDSTFIAEELESRRTGQSNRFYDVTAWALTYMFRVPAWWTRSPVGPLDAVQRVEPVVPAPPAAGRYGYVFAPGSEASLRMLAGLLADSVRVWYAQRWFRTGGRTFDHGAFLVRTQPNGEGVHEVVRRHAAASGADVLPVASAMVEAGTDLGSNSVFFIRPPRVALAGGPPIGGTSFGFAWYAFDQRLRYPTTPVAVSNLSAQALDDIDVLVLPSVGAGPLEGALGEQGRERLGAWVRNGGVLIALDGATSWLAAERTGLSRFRMRRDTVRADSIGGAPLPAGVPGAIVRAHGDTLSPILAGVRGEIPVLLFSDRVLTAPNDLRAGEVVVRYAPLAGLRLAGYLWPEVPERVAETPYVWTERVGRGRIIGFMGDPNFRDMFRGLLPLFGNAVLLGASY
jgi:hypothetical protein